MPAGRTTGAAERERLIVEHLPLVRGLARRYSDRGEPLDDLIQVGTIGLIKAIDRFEPERGVKLASFATPTILGEIRRHLRDRSRTARVPRGVQEARALISHAVAELSSENGPSPTVREIAEATGPGMDDVLDALAAGSARRPAPLASPGGGGEDDVGVSVGTEETGYERAEARATLDAGLAQLPAREPVILPLRFQEGLGDIDPDGAAGGGTGWARTSRLPDGGGTARARPAGGREIECPSRTQAMYDPSGERAFTA